MFQPFVRCVIDAVSDVAGWIGVSSALLAVILKLSGEQDIPPSRLIIISAVAFLARAIQLQWKLTETEEMARKLRENPPRK
jgi:hypothetical protein